MRWYSLTRFLPARQTKRDAARVAGMLKTAGFQVGMVVGGATKSVMEEYRHGRLMVVVATDVLARGIDVPTTGMVVMYDVTVKYEADKRWDQMEQFVRRVRCAYVVGGGGCSLCATHRRSLSFW